MKIAKLLLLLCLFALLPFQNCGQQFKPANQVVEVESNEVTTPVEVGNTDENMISKTYSVSVWKDVAPLKIYIAEKTNPQNQQVTTVFRFVDFIEVSKNYDLENEVFKDYKKFVPRVYDLKSDPKETSEIYLLNDLGTKLLSLNISSMGAEMGWEVLLVQQASPQDLLESQRNLVGAEGTIRIGSNKIQWSGDSEPIVEKVIDCLATQHLENNVCVSNVRSCPVANGTGQQTWMNNLWSSTCTVLSCNSGYKLTNGVCVAEPQCTTSQHLENNMCVSNVRSCSVPNGTGEQTWMNNLWSSTCTVLSCNSGYKLTNGACVADPQCTTSQHLENNVCVSNVRSCPVANGAGQQTWMNNMWSSTCSTVTCNNGYSLTNGACVITNTAPNCTADQHFENNGCVSNVRSCPVANGTGQQLWTNNMWSSTCTTLTCNSGYTLTNGVCVIVNTTPTCTTSQHLENNLCVSNTRSCPVGNGTGQQIWQSNTWKKCTVQSCNPGAYKLNGACIVPISNNQGPLLGSPGDLVVLEKQNTAYVAAKDTLYRINLATGVRTIVSGYTRESISPTTQDPDEAFGQGPGFSSPVKLIIHEENNSALVLARSREDINTSSVSPTFSLFKIDLVSGDRTIVSSSQIGSGSPFFEPLIAKLSPTKSKLYILEGKYQVSRCLKTVDLVTGERKAITGDCNGVASVGTGPTIDYREHSKIFHISPDEKFAYLFSDSAVVTVDLATGQRSVGALSGNGGTWPQLGPNNYNEYLEADDANSTVTLLVSRKIRADGTARPAIIRINYKTRTSTLVEQFANNLVQDEPYSILGGAPFALQISLKRIYLFDNSLSIERYDFANLSTGSATKIMVSNNRIGSGSSLGIGGSLALNTAAGKIYASADGLKLTILEIDVNSGEKKVLSNCDNLGVTTYVVDQFSILPSKNRIVVHPVTGDLYVVAQEARYRPDRGYTGVVGSVIKINPVDGLCTIISGRVSKSARKGDGDYFLTPAGVTIDPQGANLYLAAQTVTTDYLTPNYTNQLIKVNLQSGDRTSLFSEPGMKDVQISADGNRIYSLTTSLDQSILSYNLATGEKSSLPRSLLNEQGGSFGSVGLSDLVSVVGANDFVYAAALSGGIYSIETKAGVVKVISNGLVGDGPTFEEALEVLSDSSNNSIYALDGTILYKFNLTTNTRTLIAK